MRLAWATLPVLYLMATSAFAHEGECKTEPSPAAHDAQQALQANPNDLSARLKLADAQIADSCYEDAIHTLQEGEALHGRNQQLQARLREAQSMLRERSYFEGLDRAEQAAKISRSLLRCNKLADIDACDQALALQPDDIRVVIAKADALMQAKRPTDALAIYRRAQQLAPDDSTIAAKLSAADTQSRELLAACMNSTGQPALQACQSRRARGAEHEFDILKRIGTLQQAANQPEAALDSFIAASLLQPADRSVARSIVGLSTSTGRNDALTLAARGSALLTLDRAMDALTPLKQAVALTPDLPEARVQLERAERLAKAHAKQVLDKHRQVAVVGDTIPAVMRTQPVQTAAPPRQYSNAAPVNNSN
ncbi:MAG: tetratricopeptide repeat protein [Steroidobacter sp.]